MNDNKTDAALKPGDVVILKSGGPAMTVLVSHGSASDVAWFTSSDYSDDDLRTRTFPNAALDLLPDYDDEDGDGERTVQVVDIGLRPANSDAISTEAMFSDDPQWQAA